MAGRENRCFEVDNVWGGILKDNQYSAVVEQSMHSHKTKVLVIAE